MNAQSYTYAEDSKFMGDVLSTLEPGLSFLEIGVGNGGNQRVVRNKFGLVVGTDVVYPHEAKLENPFAEMIAADRASCFRSSVFDVVAFNPPYIPTDAIQDRAVDGGQGGVEVPIAFLESALTVVKGTGKILLLLSSEDDMKTFEKFCSRNHVYVRKIAERRLFFETLTIFELRPNASKT